MGPLPTAVARVAGTAAEKQGRSSGGERDALFYTIRSAVAESTLLWGWKSITNRGDKHFVCGRQSSCIRQFMQQQPSDSLNLKLVRLLGLLIVVAGIDQWSKVYAVEHWKDQPRQSFLNDLFRIEYAQNEGAFLSLFAGLPEAARFWILTVCNGLLLLGVAVYLLRSRQLDRWTFWALGLVVAGGVGNLIDRVRFGYVIDYFNLGIALGGREIRTGIFNVADMAITAGFIMMVPILFRGEAQPRTAEPIPSGESQLSAAKPS